MAAPPIYSGTQENSPGTTFTAGNYQGYLSKPGQLFIAPQKFYITSASGFPVITRSAAGIYLAGINPGANILIADLAQLLSSVILPPPPPAGGISYKQGNTGPGMGLTIQSVTLVYKIVGVALVSGSVALYQAVFSGNLTEAIPVVNTLLAPTATQLAVNADIYVTNYPLITPLPLSAAQEGVHLEVNLDVNSGGAVFIYGAFINVGYNY
jgi:hypothetical protein